MRILNVFLMGRRLVLELAALVTFVAIAAFLVLALVAPANAAGTSSTVTWKLPTTRLSGAPLATTKILKSTVIWRRPGGSAVVGTLDVPGAATSAVVPNLVCGDFVFTVTVTANDVVAPDSPTSAESSPPAAYATGVSCSCPAPPTEVNAS